MKSKAAWQFKEMKDAISEQKTGFYNSLVFVMMFVLFRYVLYLYLQYIGIMWHFNCTPFI